MNRLFSGFQSQERPKRIIIIRHAESLGNLDNVVYSNVADWKIPITHAGAAAAKESAQEIAALVGNDPVFAYTSPYRR